MPYHDLSAAFSEEALLRHWENMVEHTPPKWGKMFAWVFPGKGSRRNVVVAGADCVHVIMVGIGKLYL